MTLAILDVSYEAATVGGVSGWWCSPPNTIEGAAILYLHGGAYVLGSASAYRNFAAQIAVRAKAVTFIPDYKLAPEHQFPGAVDDALAAYRGLSGAGYSSLALAGDSAGGGVALSLLSIATAISKDGSVLRPTVAAVMSPWTDLALAGDSIKARADADPLLTRDALQKAAKLYLGEQDLRNPQASPLYSDLAGLPPVLLPVGEDEILLDDSRRYAERINSAGGTARIDVWQGMVHVFPSNVELLHAAREALDDIGEFLHSHLGRVLVWCAARAAGAKALPAAEIETFTARYRAGIQAGQALNPPAAKIAGRRGRAKQSTAFNLLRRLREHEPELLFFMHDLAVPFTNNLAERAIRMPKVKQRISGYFRTFRGAKNFCLIRSYLDTARKRGYGLLQSLQAAFSGISLNLA